MPMRLTGLMSGMDTESVIQQLVEAKKTKVTTAVKAQKSLKYKQDAWKTLNTQILNLYNKSLSNMRWESSFVKKTTKVSNSNIVSVITGEGAMNSVQNLRVDQLARSGYLTGGEMKLADGAEGDKVTSDTKLSDLGFPKGGGTIRVTINGEYANITVDENSTVGNFVKALRETGVNANFDEANGRIHVSSKEPGAAANFEISGTDIGGLEALSKLGLSYNTAANADAILKSRQQNMLDSFKKMAETSGSQLKERLRKNGVELDNLKAEDMTDEVMAVMGKVVEKEKEQTTLGDDYKNQLGSFGDNVSQLKVDAERLKTIKDEAQKAEDEERAPKKTSGEDAVIYLNGVKYTSSSNSIKVNGLTLTVNAKTAPGEEVTITTQDDTDGIYDMVKNFLKEYNTLINQMDKLYNADSAKGYEPLTDEEKSAMSDSAIEEWEKKITDSILRKDESLGTISNAMKKIMMEGVEVNGKKMYLSNFGINTLSYFSAPENEKNSYHIDGDPDDSATSGNADMLKSMIANDPDTVVAFFTGLAKNLYGEMTEKMKHTEYSSAYTAYEDTRMQKEYDDYTVKIKELEKKLADYEDKWYAKFAAMETAMAKMQNNASAVTSLLGG